jgi:hypothetical protein
MLTFGSETSGGVSSEGGWNSSPDDGWELVGWELACCEIEDCDPVG